MVVEYFFFSSFKTYLRRNFLENIQRNEWEAIAAWNEWEAIAALGCIFKGPVLLMAWCPVREGAQSAST